MTSRAPGLLQKYVFRVEIEIPLTSFHHAESDLRNGHGRLCTSYCTSLLE